VVIKNETIGGKAAKNRKIVFLVGVLLKIAKNVPLAGKVTECLASV